MNNPGDLMNQQYPPEAVAAVARVLAEQFAKNPPVNGSKDFRIDARAALDAVRAIRTAAEEAGNG